MSVFVDTSAWFAALNRKDKDHPRAKKIIADCADLVTSDFVLVEAWLLAKNRTSFQAAQSFWAGVRSGLARVEKITDLDLDHAWHTAQTYKGQEFSLVDLTSFVLMERLGVKRAVSFDNDFVIYRYGPARDRAFEVLR